MTICESCYWSTCEEVDTGQICFCNFYEIEIAEQVEECDTYLERRNYDTRICGAEILDDDCGTMDRNKHQARSADQGGKA